MTSALVETGAAAVGGAIHRHRPRTWTQRHAITIVNGQTSLNYLPALHLPYVAGANAGFDTAQLRAVGGFDEDLRSGNDVDVCYKLGLRGHTVALTPAAVVEHEDRATVWAHARRFRFYAVYQVLLFAKYRQVSGKRLVLDTYPLRRTADAIRATPPALVGLIRGDAASLSPDPAAAHRSGRGSPRRDRGSHPVPPALHLNRPPPEAPMDPTHPPIQWSTRRQLTRRGVLWLGLRCDVRCKFCYDELVTSNLKAWMLLDEAVQALNKFRSFYHNEFVDLMGGEPTLHPQAVDIVAHAARIGLRPTIITHGMRLADRQRARAYADAGIHDVLISIHGVGDTVAAIHGRGRDNFARQMTALDNLRELGVPFRFNVTMIRDNLAELEAIAALAARTGARVVNFLTFNPYFEWTTQPEIEFQARHSDIAPYLARAIERCTAGGVEANVRYMPPCQLRGHEAHVYTGFQLPYDPHEWDYNSWYDTGHEGSPDPAWYLRASQRQQQRHHYTHVAA
jgi:sulfatase maturation enzyme AslB (radical SAM superfamily)